MGPGPPAVACVCGLGKEQVKHCLTMCHVCNRIPCHTTVSFATASPGL